MSKKILLSTVLSICLPLFLTLFSTPVYAGTCSWDGSTDNDWNDASNWGAGCTGAGGIPGDGDDLIFPAAMPNRTMENAIVGLNLRSLTFETNYIISSGNSFSVSDGMSGTAQVIINPEVTMDGAGAQTWEFTGGGLFINGNLTLNQTLNISGDVTLDGVVSGTANIQVLEDSNLTLSDNNTFSGTITHRGYHIVIAHSNALGNSSNELIVDGGVGIVIQDMGASLNIPNNITFSDLTPGVDSGIINNGEDNTLSGDITIEEDLQIRVDADTLTLSAAVSGVGGIVKESSGSLQLTGNVTNSFSGGLTINNGQVELGKTSAEAIYTDIVVGDGIGADESAILILITSDQISGNIVINEDGLFDLNGEDDTIDTLTGYEGVLDIPTGSLLTVVSYTNTVFAGEIMGAGELLKAGTGAWTTTYNSQNFTGYVSVGEGTLIMNGNLSNAVATINGGTLSGFGEFENITGTDGRISPGNVLNGTSAMNIFGNLSTTNLITFDIHLNGNDFEDWEYDRFVVSGDVSLNDAVLNIIPGYDVLGGTSFTILEADGTITGEFDSLPNFSTITVGDEEFIIRYYENRIELHSPVELYLLEFKSSANSYNVGYPVTLSVKWGSNGILPTGSVNFYTYPGNISLGTANLVNGEGSITLSNLTLGSYNVLVSYSGDDLFGGAIAGSPIAFTINTAPVQNNTNIQTFASADLEEEIEDETPLSFPITDEDEENLEDDSDEVLETTKVSETQNGTSNLVLIIGGAIFLSVVGYFFYRSYKKTTE